MPIVLALDPRARLIAEPDQRVIVGHDSASLVVDAPAPGLRQVLTQMLGTGGTEANLMARVLEHDGSDGPLALARCLLALSDRRLLHYRVAFEGATPAATAIPTGPLLHRSGVAYDPARAVALSRFAYLRRQGSELVIESPLSAATVIVHDERVAGLLRLPNLGSAPAVWSLAELLWNANLLTATTAESTLDESTDPLLVPWEFHDLAFHARSRGGRHPYPSGRTYSLRGVLDRPPVVAPHEVPHDISLSRPDLAALAATDMPLTRALESRRSRREHGDVPVTVEQVGEFLFRSARVVAVIAHGDSDVSRRPYPGGGACYELELYLVVRACAGLERGLYHYCPQAHALGRVAAADNHLETLLAGAASASASDHPQVLVVIAARFGRVMWKYSSVSYAVILKDVGALYQTMYLVATAMGLSACALGGGDADAFSRAAGTDYYSETSVGEFILGSRRVDPI